MTLTLAQTISLEALELAFGPTDDGYLQNVTSREGLGEYGYEHWITRELKSTLIHWMQYKYALSQNWDEIDRIKREAEALKRAGRADEVRDAVVIGFLSGLLAKMSKKFPEAVTSFDLNKDGACLLVDKEGHELQVSYYRSSKSVYTLIEDVEYTEDVTDIRGSISPREQLVGFAAVLDYLDAA